MSTTTKPVARREQITNAVDDHGNVLIPLLGAVVRYSGPRTAWNMKVTKITAKKVHGFEVDRDTDLPTDIARSFDLDLLDGIDYDRRVYLVRSAQEQAEWEPGALAAAQERDRIRAIRNKVANYNREREVSVIEATRRQYVRQAENEAFSRMLAKYEAEFRAAQDAAGDAAVAEYDAANPAREFFVLSVDVDPNKGRGYGCAIDRKYVIDSLEEGLEYVETLDEDEARRVTICGPLSTAQPRQPIAAPRAPSFFDDL